MRRCCLPVCLLLGLFSGLLRPAPAAAFDLLGWLNGDHRSHTAEYLGGAEPDEAVPQPPLGIAALAPQYGQVPGVPSFRWGYFGAPHQSTCFSHKGYHGDCSWWSHRPR